MANQQKLQKNISDLETLIEKKKINYTKNGQKREQETEKILKNFVSDMVDLSGSYKNKNIKILTGESVKYSDFSKGNTPWIYYEV